MPEVACGIVQDIEERDGRLFATSGDPWLKLDIDPGLVAGRWVRLTYSAGLLEPLVRPVLRIFAGDSHRDEIMPAALHGRGCWLGSIPKAATEIWISPTDRPGPFAFRVEACGIAPRIRLLAELFAADRWRGIKCAWAGVLGRRNLARLQVRRALCSTPLRQYDSWRKARLRPFDRERFDRPPIGAGQIPNFRLVVSGEGLASGAIESLSRRLHSQPYPSWSLAVVDAGADSAAPKISFVASGAPFGRWIEGLQERDFLLPIGAGDILADYALDALSAASMRHPDIDLFYGDEDSVDERGVYGDPRLKPDWSPTLQAGAPYLGAAIAIRVGLASKLYGPDRRLNGAEFSEVALALDPESSAVFHIRRVLLTRPRGKSRPAVAPRAETPEETSLANDVEGRLQASIIIPTRDRLDLLQRCVSSVEKHTIGVNFELIVVDNGSVEPRTLAYLRELATTPNRRVIAIPGPFNYSRLCNRAAFEARAPFLVFLNNDVEAFGGSWLALLLRLAANSDVGAVGARLLYRDGSVQHAGVVLGIDGRAGHFQRGLAAADRGYFGSLGVAHETSAVTAACLAVESAKFAAVGGFDESNLPIEYNDLDLCLRLAEAGWKTLLEPRATLVHLESASRGANPLLDERYGEQAGYFVARWADALRDDPYFHPALSLDSLDAALG